MPIAIGLAALIVSGLVPAIPVVSAMALVAFGATEALSSRVARSQVGATAMAIHLFVYSSLYLLFVGAVVHASMSGPRYGIHLLLMLDVCASALVMAVVVRKATATIFRIAN